MGIGGIDLSENTDLTCAKVLIMKPDDPVKYFITRYFIPESKIPASKLEENDENKNYKDWVKQGLMEVHPGNEIDYSKITEWYVSLYKNFKIRMFKIILDRWGQTTWPGS